MSDSLFPEMDSPQDAAAASGGGSKGPAGAASGPKGSSPLADRMRPRSLEEVAGQQHLLEEGKVLRRLIEEDQVSSMILWGPPGVGKTTLARLVARHSRSHFVSLSAVLSGVKDIKQVVEQSRRMAAAGRPTVLFIDELHRFNKAQQDALLPHVESGALTLIGATTENPSFEVIAPLLSRSRVFVLHPLEEEDILSLLRRALEDRERGLGDWELDLEDGVLERIAAFADGDARQALNSLEVASRLARASASEGQTARLTAKVLSEALQSRHLRYDKAGEEHYNIISALHKSMRNSDIGASLYWLSRMLEAGEDPRYILRRMIRFASEDVGLADPDALGRAVDALRAYDFVGLPEGKLFLAQTAVYLARAPKSNAVYKAYGKVEKDVRQTRSEPVPLHLRNAPTKLMKDLGYGKGYRYAHDEGRPVEEMNCLPDKLKDRRYWEED
ncbi:MAG TPA: replication-associated recombination protein A [Acidobacteriota bacterium]|nr:replication-associated recombination protein A [Acidobacteriota bacterium]